MEKKNSEGRQVESTQRPDEICSKSTGETKAARSNSAHLAGGNVIKKDTIRERVDQEGKESHANKYTVFFNRAE